MTADELKIDIKKLCDIEFICNKCKTKITFDFTKRKMMFERCPNCGEEFVYNGYKDPIILLTNSIESFKNVGNLSVNLIVKD